MADHFSALPEIAHYYPEPYWAEHEIDWVKTVLLFFDGLSILMPHYSVSGGSRARRLDPVLGEPLIAEGLLHVLSPEELIDQSAAESFAGFLTDLITNGALDELDLEAEYSWLSGSRMARLADRNLSDMVIEELRTKGLIREEVESGGGVQPTYSDGSAVLIHPTVRRIILAFWAQALRGPGERLGYALQPITSRTDITQTMSEVLRSPQVSTAGEVLQLDLVEVSYNLSSVPLDDVLQFRRDYGSEHREYMRSLRRVMSELQGLEGNDRLRVLVDRRDQIRDTAEYLKKTTRRHLIKKGPGFALSLVGAALHAAAGNLAGAASSSGGALGQIVPPGTPGGAYSYLFRLEKAFSA